MEIKKRSAEQMVKMFIDDPELMSRLKENPLTVLKETAARAEAVTDPVYMRDKLVYRIAVIILGILGLTTAIGSIILVLNKITTPEVLVALGSASVGALVGLFAPSPVSK